MFQNIYVKNKNMFNIIKILPLQYFDTVRFTFINTYL